MFRILDRRYAANSRRRSSAVGLPRRETKACSQWAFTQRCASSRQTVDAPDRLRHPQRKYCPVTRVASRIVSSLPVGTPTNSTAPKQPPQNDGDKTASRRRAKIRKKQSGKSRAARAKNKMRRKQCAAGAQKNRGKIARRRRTKMKWRRSCPPAVRKKQHGGELRALAAPKLRAAGALRKYGGTLTRRRRGKNEWR